VDATKHQRMMRTIFWVALGCVFMWTSVSYTKKVAESNKSAIIRWSTQIQDMESGDNIHEKYNYPNPPIMVFILWPFSELATVSTVAAALTWFYLKIAMAGVCLWWSFKLVETPSVQFPVWAKMLAVALSLRPFLGDLTHGNVNIFVLFVVMSSLYSYSRGRDTLAGVLLALAIACKVTPALFLLYFAWKRSWWVLVGCALGLGLFFFVVPSTIYGLQSGSIIAGYERNWAALTSWFRGMIVPYLVYGIVTPERENQSLPGILTRLLSHQPSFTAWANNFYTPLAFHNVADLDSATIKHIVQVCQGVFVLLMLWVCRTRAQQPGLTKEEARRGWPLAAEYSLILIGMLMFSERTWKHHCVTLLLPFVVLCYGLVPQVGLSTMRRRIIGAVLVLATLFIMATSSGVFADVMPEVKKQYAAMSVATGAPMYSAMVENETTAEFDLIPWSPGKMAQVYGAYVWAFMVLLLGLCVMLRHARSQAK
jgi:alpha-1,2-mannosyltransferase